MAQGSVIEPKLACNKACINGGFAFAVVMDGRLHGVDASEMNEV